ncbi:hypothetical protein NTGBS_520014 [Candidatus Nitrotoga sp. BS]|nr:hypothetical protein NTGBS_520014 [Candidatus Nitrotoga sp. BS]
MVACCKKERVASESNRKNFSGKFKVKVAIEGIRGIKTVNEIGQEFGGRIDRVRVILITPRKAGRPQNKIDLTNQYYSDPINSSDLINSH